MFVALLLVGIQDVSAPQAPDRIVTLEIAAGDPVLAGRGPGRRVESTIEFAGVLHVWTSVEGDLDTCVRVEDAAGKLLAEDDDAGGAPTPYVELGVVRDQRLVFVVAAAKPGGSGRVDLHLVAAPETSETLAVAADGKRKVAEATAARLRGELDAARALLRSAASALASTPGGDRSDAVDGALRAVALEARLEALSKLGAEACGLSLAHLERTLPRDHLELQRARCNLAVLSTDIGDLTRARRLDEQALAALARTRPDTDRDRQAVQSSLAQVLFAAGQTAAARAQLEVLLEVRARTLPDDDPGLQGTRGNLAAVMRVQGDLVGARALQERILAVLSRKLPDDHRDLQAARVNLGATLYSLGDLPGARALFEQALVVLSRTLPGDHRDVQTTRLALAATLYLQDDFAAARDLFGSVLEVLSRTLPDDDAELQRARGDLAMTLRALGELDAARVLQERVLEILSRTLPDDHPDLLEARTNLAMTLEEQGDLSAARTLEERVLDLRSQRLDDTDPRLQESRADVARNAAQRRDRERTVHISIDLARATSRRLDRAALTLSPREAESVAENADWAVSNVLSLATGAGVLEPLHELEEPAFVLVEAARSIGLRSARAARIARASTPEEPVAADPVADSIAALRREIATRDEEAARRALTFASRDEYLAAVRDRDRAERDLRALLEKSAGPFAAPADVRPRSIAAALAQGEAAVGFWRYARRRADPRATGRWIREPCLLAWIVRKDGSLERVELGPIEAIASAVAAWRRSIGTEGPDSAGLAGRGIPAAGPRPATTASERECGEALRKLVFDPIVPALHDATRIVVALDDVLHVVPLDALPYGDDVLGSVFAITVRPALADLVAAASPRSGAGAVVLFGGLDFGTEPEPDSTSRPASAVEAAVRPPPRGEPWAASFSALPATRAEIRRIAALHMTAFAEDERPVLIEDRAGNRRALAELAPRARFLHLATHGWFAPDSVVSSADPRSDPEHGPSAIQSREDQVRRLSPMVLCGLALSGANGDRGSPDRPGGVVTAEELSGLDLSGCELVVLSACDANVGFRHAGQGVASLQKALHMAGARCVIASLWKVSDEATKDFMIEFYRRLWIEKASTGKALWGAKMRLRATRDEAGRSTYSTRDWAAWVLTGDPN